MLWPTKNSSYGLRLYCVFSPKIAVPYYCYLHLEVQTHKEAYKTQEGWQDLGQAFFSGNAILNVTDHLLDWTMVMIFDHSINEIQVRSLRQHVYNSRLEFSFVLDLVTFLNNFHNIIGWFSGLLGR